jgi:hypothetical protein
MSSIEDIATEALKAFEHGHQEEVGRLLRCCDVSDQRDEVIARFLKPFGIEAARAIDHGNYGRVEQLVACLLEHTDDQITYSDIAAVFADEGGDPGLVPAKNGTNHAGISTIELTNG